MNDRKESGPAIYINWKHEIGRKPIKSWYEVPLFSDAHIIGEAIEGLGPYKLFNTFASASPSHIGYLAPAIMLRVKQRYIGIPLKQLRKEKTDDDLYHGGGLNDEIAAVLSLLMGIRLKAGGLTRYFDDIYPKGKPIRSHMYQNPVLSPIQGFGQNLRIPRAQSGNFKDMKLVKTIPDLPPKAAITLIKAARLYQDGLWIAENAPELSWILFASSIETAANYWRSSRECPLERMTINNPKLRKLLEDKGGVEFAKKVAELVSDSMGATKKFIDFIGEHIPDPPADRPSKLTQIEWEINAIKKLSQKIYSYRSRKLHSGKSIPAPMCEVPMKDPQTKKPGEIFYWLMSAKHGGVWKKKDIPMNMHTFEYITRNVIINWWRKLL